MDWTLHFKNLITDQPLMAILASFWGGILASFTPCTYPVIPITVAFLGHQASANRPRLFLLSFMYATGLAVVYTALGIFASLTGKIFGSWAGNKILYIAVGNICILAALIMFGVLRIRTPRFVSSLGAKTNLKGVTGSFFMGATSALIVGPCTTPILGVLLSIAATGKNLLHTSLLFLAFSYGLSMVVVLAGLFAGLLSAMPKAGKWLYFIQYFFAFAMIVIGEYFLYKAGSLSGF